MVNEKMVPPQLEKYVDQIDEFMERYPTLTMHGEFSSFFFCQLIDVHVSSKRSVCVELRTKPTDVKEDFRHLGDDSWIVINRIWFLSMTWDHAVSYAEVHTFKKADEGIVF